jgi:ethanolamine ammonia-lyase small subunit
VANDPYDVEAGAHLGTVIQKILKYKASGMSLVKKEHEEEKREKLG